MLVTLLGLTAGSLAQERQTFTLRHRPAAELVEPLRDLLGPSARVAAFNETLVVVAPAADLALAADLVARFDQPRRMLRIHVDQDLARTGDALSIDGSARVRLPGGPGRARLDATATERWHEQRVSQFLLVLNGEAARIAVGRSIPVTQRYLALCRRYGYLIETVEYHSVTTGFEVRPELLEEQVRLEMVPYMAFLADSQAREVVFQELATRVRVPLDRWYELGGHLADQDEVSRTILGAGEEKRQTRSTVRVLVELAE